MCLAKFYIPQILGHRDVKNMNREKNSIKNRVIATQAMTKKSKFS